MHGILPYNLPCSSEKKPQFARKSEKIMMETLVTKKVSIVLRLNFRYGGKRADNGQGGRVIHAVRDAFCIHG
jgi:hypothetical protein